MTAAAPRTALYTPDLLALAVSLAEFPLDPALTLKGEARSQTCGSTMVISCTIDGEGRVERLGLRASACAVGQAAAALFARSAVGRDRSALLAEREAIAAWLGGHPEAPRWPGLEVLGAARAYPARHGAILLAWDAGLAALSKGDSRG